MLAFGVCCIYGFTSSFHLKESINFNGWLILSLALLISIPWFFDKHPSSKINKLPIFKKLLAYFGLICFMAMISFSFIYMFIPSVYTLVFGEPFTKQTQVVKKTNRFNKKGCDIRIKVKVFTSKVCVTEHFYNQLKVGDMLTLKGLESDFGYKVMSLSHTSN
jgi:Ni,Fe-hydrogenase I cytochrome b subunit